MPIREYKCKKCSKTFEHIQVRSDDKPECPECKSKQVEQQFSMSGQSFQLKGKGWYKDKYS
mgnify:CR=1 FL=1